MKLDDIKNMEATYLDYKESLETTKPVSWLKSVVAFANTKGGHIIFGVTDEEHKFIGIDNLQQTSSKISELISTRVSPWPRFTLAPIDSEYQIRNALIQKSLLVQIIHIIISIRKNMLFLCGMEIVQKKQHRQSKIIYC